MKKIIVISIIMLFYSSLYGQKAYKFLKLSSSPAYSSLADPCSLYIDNASSFVYNPAFLALNP
ncbi:MAG: hypothetical protein JW827_12270, partial [Spirochaetes bacterium]|nr:hypothetical protein [Spirochaetota bacterium]